MYYVYEQQVRPDGVVNVVEPVSRSTVNLGKSYYYERASKACASEQFTDVGLMLCDEKMYPILKETFVTSYVEPEEEPEEETAE